MTPGPTLEDLITIVRTDAASDNALDQLAAASLTVANMEEVADAALAHFVDQCRRQGHSWSEISKALGVTKQAAHKRFSDAPPSLARFTLRAQKLLAVAVEQAQRLGHNFVGTEHLLLALLADPDSVASKVLADVGVTSAAVEERVIAAMPRTAATADAPPYTPKATTCIEQAISEALRLGHNYVGTEHILLALFAQPDALASSILTQLKVTYEDSRRRVVGKLSG